MMLPMEMYVIRLVVFMVVIGWGSCQVTTFTVVDVVTLDR